MVKDPGEYVRSSYRSYITDGSKQPWLDTTEVLRQFSRTVREDQKALSEICIGRNGRGAQGRVLRRARWEISWGSTVCGGGSKSKAGEEKRVRIKIKADALLEAVCKVLGMTRREVIGAGKDRERVRARELVCHVGRSCTELSVKGLAEMLGVDPTCVSRSVARMEVRLKTDKRLEGTFEQNSRQPSSIKITNLTSDLPSESLAQAPIEFRRHTQPHPLRHESCI